MKYQDKDKVFRKKRDSDYKERDHYRKLKQLKSYEKYQLDEDWNDVKTNKHN